MSQLIQISKREDMALTSKRVRVFMGDLIVARSMSRAIRLAKKGGKGAFTVSEEMYKQAEK